MDLKDIPKTGIYRTKEGGIVVEVIGIGHHTEVAGLEASAMVIYRNIISDNQQWLLGDVIAVSAFNFEKVSRSLKNEVGKDFPDPNTLTRMNPNRYYPNKGYYRHYKHETAKGPGNYTYQVVHLAKSSEETAEPEFAVYRPMYESEVYRAGKHFHIRPIKMFLSEVNEGRYQGRRFSWISDSATIRKLEDIKVKMYG